ncbi:MAG: helix-turn-helix domain-containing protein [Clostridia bacterium]|nr:helix-turn-helix domain-containing protein [Clostridia bacterium]
MEDIKDTIARNLVKLRTQAGYTQLQLAEMLNYSDKAVSKWERGEATPDIRVLSQIAGIYGITVDQLISAGAEDAVKPRRHPGKKRILIAALSAAFCFFVATVIFMILYFIPHTEHYAGCIFTVAFVAASIVLTILSSFWWGKIVTCVFASLIVWSDALLIHIFFLLFAENRSFLEKIYIVYLVALAMQALVILWFAFRKVK